MTDTLSPPEFPLYAMNQLPADDLAKARSLLRILAGIVERSCDKGMDGRTVCDIIVLLDEAMISIEPIQLFLDEIDAPDSTYQECRRRIIIERIGRAVS